jgi:hypothetical protein
MLENGYSFRLPVILCYITERILCATTACRRKVLCYRLDHDMDQGTVLDLRGNFGNYRLHLVMPWVGIRGFT